MESSRAKGLAAFTVACLLVPLSIGELATFAGVSELPDRVLLQNGDVIFRRGAGFASELARRFSRGEKRFSHVGIVVVEHDQVAVIHSVIDDEREQDGVVVETLEVFLDRMDDWAVYRARASKATRNRIVEIGKSARREGIRFDVGFDLETKDVYYCTELIMRAINEASRSDLIRAQTSVAGRLFVSISDLHSSPSMQLVADSRGAE